MLNGKVMIIHLVVGWIKEDVVTQKVGYFSQKLSYFLPYFPSKNQIKVELNLSNYTTKSDLKRVGSVDILQIAKNII